MTEDEVIDKVCDRVVNTIYNELDYYMFEFLGYTETNEQYVKDAEFSSSLKTDKGRRVSERSKNWSNRFSLPIPESVEM